MRVCKEGSAICCKRSAAAKCRGALTFVCVMCLYCQAVCGCVAYYASAVLVAAAAVDFYPTGCCVDHMHACLHNCECE